MGRSGWPLAFRRGLSDINEPIQSKQPRFLPEVPSAGHNRSYVSHILLNGRWEGARAYG